MEEQNSKRKKTFNKIDKKKIKNIKDIKVNYRLASLY